MRWWIFSLLLLMSGVPGAAECAERRVALIVGNDAYVKISPLHNAGNDARRMAQALKTAGFETTVKIDTKRRALYAAIDDFAAQIASSTETVGLFYYAGHGIQANGNNYLIPVDADIDSESDLEAEAVDAGKVLRAMGEAHNRLNILVLDACRDNPLPKKSRSASRGLARMDAPTGTFIAYAAGPGQTAEDGSAGGNGLFTGELVKAMAVPGLPIEQVFKTAAAGVRSQTANKQVPWTEESLQGDFYFQNAAVTTGAAAAPTAASAAPAPAPAPAGTDPGAFELAFWNSVKDSKNPAEIKSYLDKYPKGNFAELAKVKYKELRPAATPKPPSEAPTHVAIANPPVASAAPSPPAAAAPTASSPGTHGYLQLELQWSQEESAPVVRNVVEGGAAARAGIQTGDVIVAFDGHKIESQGDLQRFQAKASPGQSVDIGIRRHGIASTVFNLVLGSGPPPEAAQRSAAEPASMLAQDRPAAGLPPGPPDGFGGERKDFDVRPQTTLQYNVGTHTPTSLPGAHVINTEALARIKNGMLLIDAWNDRSHATLPGAIRMPAAGAAGSFDDATQAALRTALAIRTDHNMMKPLVFFCAGVNCWESYNAALRALNLGYREVFWYRGGVAAWRAAGLTLVPP